MGDGERPMGMANGTEKSYQDLEIILKHEVILIYFHFGEI